LQTKTELRRWVLLLGLVLLLLALDQLTKWLVRQNLAVGEAWAPIPALAKVFTITHVQNTGVAFGQFPGLGWVFMLVNLAVVVAVLVYYPRIPGDQWQLRVASALILAGALGGAIDRLRTALILTQDTGSLWTSLPLASVTDFMDFKVWPVWNLSDLCVVTGVAIVAWTLWRAEADEKADKPSGQQAAGGEREGSS
jgi:signal peptidase II